MLAFTLGVNLRVRIWTTVLVALPKAPSNETLVTQYYGQLR